MRRVHNRRKPALYLLSQLCFKLEIFSPLRALRLVSSVNYSVEFLSSRTTEKSHFSSLSNLLGHAIRIYNINMHTSIALKYTKTKTGPVRHEFAIDQNMHDILDPNKTMSRLLRHLPWQRVNPVIPPATTLSILCSSQNDFVSLTTKTTGT